MPAINTFAATRLGSILMLIIALISAAMAALALIKISGQAAEFEIVNIVVAKQDLKATEIITRDLVALKPYPRESLLKTRLRASTKCLLITQNLFLRFRS